MTRNTLLFLLLTFSVIVQETAIAQETGGDSPTASISFANAAEAEDGSHSISVGVFADTNNPPETATKYRLELWVSMSTDPVFLTPVWSQTNTWEFYAWEVAVFCFAGIHIPSPQQDTYIVKAVIVDLGTPLDPRQDVIFFTPSELVTIGP